MMRYLICTLMLSGCSAVTPGMCVPLTAPMDAVSSFERRLACSTVLNVADTQRIRRGCPEATLEGLACPIPEDMLEVAQSDVRACSELIEATEGCADLRDVTATCFCPRP